MSNQDHTTALPSPPVGAAPGRISQKAQPPKFSPSITDLPYRKISIYFSVPLAKLPVTANQITVFWICLGLAADAMLGSSRYGWEVLAAVLFQISYLFDFVDGEVARLQERTSKRGLFLDLSGHVIVKCGVFLGIAFRVAELSWGQRYLLLAFLACIALSGLSILYTFGSYTGVSKWKKLASPAQGLSRILRRGQPLFGLAFESPGVYGLILLAMVFRKTQWLLLFYGVCGPIWLVLQLAEYRHEGEASVASAEHVDG